MSVLFSLADLMLLERSLRVLLTPLDYPSIDAWRGAAVETVKVLLGADQGTFLLPGHSCDLYYCETEEAERAAAAYRDYFVAIDPGYPVRRKQLGLQVIHESMIYDMATFRRSELYTDYAIPHRLFDVVSMWSDQEEEPFPAGMLFFHERESSPTFGERGLALLRVLFPAFQAGTEVCLRIGQQERMLGPVLDHLSEGVMLVSAAGATVYANAALLRMLATDARGRQLEEEMLGFGRQLGALIVPPRRPGEPRLSGATVCELPSLHTGYRLVGSLLDEGVAGREPLVLLMVQRTEAELPGEAALRERFGLSRKEARVALLLAGRASNNEIARELCISPHTARHHTEQVLLKLGVHSRFAVRTRMSARPDSGDPSAVTARLPD
jgi:DNA-binding CsgD family transcriptional regulator